MGLGRYPHCQGPCQQLLGGARGKAPAWADETKDQHAVHRIMGHAIPAMSGVYADEIELHRLRAVFDDVRNKVLPSR